MKSRQAKDEGESVVSAWDHLSRTRRTRHRMEAMNSTLESARLIIAIAAACILCHHSQTRYGSVEEAGYDIDNVKKIV